eukprot:m.55100 g.55100  ORF g.55100 m.55100 type:complete len:583 (+) comp22022_c0_seq1:198-1946(+)
MAAVDSLLTPHTESTSLMESRLVETHVFVVGGNSAIEAQPSVVHFGGFEINKTQKFKLKLLNKGAKATRVHVVGPTTSFFSSSMSKLDAGLFPGLAETVEIQFTPLEWRYYYDCIRVQVQHGENLLIPIHAYPVPGKVEIPSRIDFGSCAIGESVCKRIPLSCNVPIDFDFEVQVAESSPSIEITPQQGQIPAKGTTSLSITFTPQAYKTSTCMFNFRLSGFNSKTVSCFVTGSCAVGLAQKKRLKELETEESVSLTSTTTTTTSSRRATPVAPKLKKKKQRSSEELVKPPPPTVIDGIRVPKSLVGMASINYILNQPPAKLVTGIAVPLVDSIVEKNPSGRAERDKKFLEGLRSELSERHDCGETPCSSDELAAIAHEHKRDIARYLTAQAKDADSMLHVSTSLVTNVDDMLFRTHRRVDGSGKATSLIPKGATVTFAARPTDGWRYRVDLLQRFVQAVRTVILRNRAATRLVHLKAYLSGNSPPAPLPPPEANPFLQVQAHQIAPTQLTYTPPIDMFNDDMSTWKQVEAPGKLTVDFSESGFWRLEVAREYVMAGYEVEHPTAGFQTVEEPKEATLPSLF